jgi:DNA helicase HerA-like ATPase
MTDTLTRPAHSEDGRSFTLPDATGTPFIAGTLLIVTTTTRRLLGLVEERESTAEGEPEALHGRLLGAIDGTRFDPRGGLPFAAAGVEVADAATIDLVHADMGASLEIGVNLSPPLRAARLLAHRFNRHTFWCGQSGSGKTYALGVVLEQLIAHTALPVVVFDPNSDFVRLGELNPDASGPTAELLRHRDIRVLRPNVEGAVPLRARFPALTLEAKAAVLRLDPIIDREEFNAVVHLSETFSAIEPNELLPELLGSSDPAKRALGLRIENMGLLNWEVWAGHDREATLVVDERADATVLDLGGFSTPDQQLVVALSVLDELWARREERRPVLLVIDEAHNLCSPALTAPLAVAVRERLVQIAAEGRKFGLWLLLSTQRPSKVAPGIISQCDNLALMKMSSPVDLDGLATYFGYAPTALIARSPWFRQGEALFAGGFVPAPTLLSMNARLTPEGGSDVGVPLR